MRLLAPGPALSASFLTLRMIGVEPTSGCWLFAAAVPSEVSDGVARARTGRAPRWPARSPARPCGTPRTPGSPGRRTPCSLAIVRRSSRIAPGNFWSPASSAWLCSAVAWPAVLALLMNPVMCWRSRASPARSVSESTASWLSVLFSAASSASTRSVCRSAGSARLMIASRVLPAGGQPGAEVVEDQPEAVRVRLAHDVVDEVDVDLLAVVLQRQEVLAGAGLAVRDHGERRRRLRLRGLAAGWAGSRCTSRPSSDCGRIRHEASWRKSWNPASVIFITTTALPGSEQAFDDGSVRHARVAHWPGIVTSTESTRPTLAPATRTFSPGHQEAAVVEDGPDLVAAVAPARTLAEEDQCGHAHEADDRRDAPHGPGGTAAVSHFGFGACPPESRLPSSVNGFEPPIGRRRPARDSAGTLRTGGR